MEGNPFSLKFNFEPGKVLSLTNEGILVKAGKDAIILKDIEPEISIELGEYLWAF